MNVGEEGVSGHTGTGGVSRDLHALVEGTRQGRVRDIARMLSLIEDGSEDVPRALAMLGVEGRARTVGITGAPGVGKSTITGALVGELRSRGERVGVLAVDPSSPFTGGALLGDRIRMQEHTTDDGVFIRSMAARGQLGGLAATTPQAVRVLDAAGFTTILIETVGVGQSEVDVAATADTSLVLLAPGMGDGIQAAKAGILEIGDVLVVNKADREGADQTVRELNGIIGLSERPAGSWVPKVVRTVASRGEGVGELSDLLDEHGRWLLESGEGSARRLRRARDEVEALALGILRRRLQTGLAAGVLDAAAADVRDGRRDPYTAAAQVVSALV